MRGSGDLAGAHGEYEDIPGYTRLERVGQGGFAVVYRAHQERLERVVALKVLLLDALDAGDLHRFRSECQLMARLAGHPHVVTVLDTGTARSGRPYIAMEYFDGGSLRDRLARDGPLPLDEVLRIGVKIASALSAAHAIGIIHGDVKPQNVLVSRYGEPALADFGIATLRGAAEASAPADSLTPYHAAPEVLEGHQPSAASDVYSLGSTLYQLLAGHPAHQRPAEGGLAELLLRILSEEAPEIDPADVPPAAMTVIRRAMARSAADRFPDAFALGERLRQLQSELGFPVTELVRTGRDSASESEAWSTRPARAAGGDTPPEADEQTMLRPERVGRPDAAVGRPRRQRRLLAAAGVVVVLGIALGLGVRLAMPGPAPQPPRPTRPPRPSDTAAFAPASVMAAARPTGLTVTDGGTTVVLHWQPGTTGGYPLFVQRSTGGGGSGNLTPLPAGSTTATIRGLDPQAGYCFEVGAVVAFGQPSAVAWSSPVCIRGASAVPAAASR